MYHDADFAANTNSRRGKLGIPVNLWKLALRCEEANWRIRIYRRNSVASITKSCYFLFST